MKNRVVIPSNHIRTIGGKTFMHLSTVPNFSSSLFGAYRANVGGGVGKPERLLSRTDIIGQLIILRDQKIDSELTKLKQRGGPTESLRLFKPKTAKRVRVSKVLRASLPSQVIIHAPTVGEVSGIPILALAKSKRDPMFIECTASALQYIRDVCRLQLEGGRSSALLARRRMWMLVSISSPQRMTTWTMAKAMRVNSVNLPSSALNRLLISRPSSPPAQFVSPSRILSSGFECVSCVW